MLTERSSSKSNINLLLRDCVSALRECDPDNRPPKKANEMKTSEYLARICGAACLRSLWREPWNLLKMLLTLSTNGNVSPDAGPSDIL